MKSVLFYCINLWYILLPWIKADFLSCLRNSNQMEENIQISFTILTEDCLTAFTSYSSTTTPIACSSSINLTSQVSGKTKNILQEMETVIFLSTIKITSSTRWESALQSTLLKYYASHWCRIFIIIVQIDINSKNLSESILTLVSNQFQYKSNCNKDIYIIFELDNNEITLWELYNIKYKIIAQQVKIEGNGSDSEFQCGQLLQNICWTLPRRENLRNIQQQAHFKIDADSLLDVTAVESNGKWIPQHGLSMQVLNDLKFTLNFRTNLTLGKSIKRWPNQTLKGSSSISLQNGSLDLFISLTSLLPYRKAFLSFLQPTLRTKVVACFIQPSSSSVRDIYTETFGSDVWITICATLLLTVIVMRLMCTTSENDVQDVGNDNIFKRQIFILWGVAVMTQQGWPFNPANTSSRIVFLTGYVFGYLCFVAYSAAIVSLLAIPVVPIGSFNELLGSKLQTLVDNDSTTMMYFLEGLKKGPNRENIALGSSSVGAMEKIFNHKAYSLIGTVQLIYLTMRKLDLHDSWICDYLTMLPASSGFVPYAMVVPKQSPFAELFNYKIMRMMEAGLIQRYDVHHNKHIYVYCLPKPTSRHEILGLKDVYTAFAAISIGWSLSAGMLLCEKLYFSQKRIFSV